MTRLARRCGVRLFLFLLPAMLAAPASADWVNLTGAEVAPNIAEIYVEDAGVRVELEIFVRDLQNFAALVPDDLLSEAGESSIPPQAERLHDFAETGLSIRAQNGQALPVEVRLAEPRMRVDRRSPFAGQIDPYSGRRLPEPPEDPRVLFVELYYPFKDGQPPDQLTFQPPRNEAGDVLANIGMLVFHRDVPVIDFRFLSDSATVTLDWDDPWFSKFENPNLRRHHSYPQMGFLYAEPFEVRHEALIRVRDALRLTGFDAISATLSKGEADALVEATAELLAKRSPMTIDGASVTPDFDRGAYLKIGTRGLVFIGPDEPISVDAAILGLIWSVPTDGYPQTASVEWTIFDERAPTVQGYAIDEAGPFLSPMTADDPILTWTNHFTSSAIPVVEEVEGGDWAELSVPALSAGLGLLALGGLVGAARGGSGRRRAVSVAVVIICAAGAYVALPYGQLRIARPNVAAIPMDEEQAQALTEQLLSNVYRAFEFRGEEQVYDRLAKTLDGAVLEEVYLDQRRSLRVAKAGGAEARVKDVFIESAIPTPSPNSASGFTIRTKWRIMGQVGHWGHLHTRVNSYEADLSVSAEGGSWKIDGFEVLAQDRLS